MKIVFYGRLAEAIASEIEIEAAEGCRVAELRAALAADHPAAAGALASACSRACLGDALVTDDQWIRPDDTVSFLPPVSGG